MLAYNGSLNKWSNVNPPEGTVKDVTLDGTSVVNSQGVAVLTSPTIPVTDVTVDGTSVVNSSGVAQITMPSGGAVNDVTVDGTAVVNSQGVAQISMPAVPTDLGDLAYVAVGSATDGQILKYTGTSQ